MSKPRSFIWWIIRESFRDVGLWRKTYVDLPPPVSLCVLLDNDIEPKYADKVSSALREATGWFAELGLTFEVISTDLVSLPKPFNSNLARRWKRQFLRGGRVADIIILFTEKNYSLSGSDPNIAGIWHRYGNWIMVNDVGKLHPETLITTIQHEIGHSFGAVHVDSRKSVMYKTTSGGSTWDDYNRKIIFRNRNMHR